VGPKAREKFSIFGASDYTPVVTGCLAPARPKYAANAANKIPRTWLLQLGRMTATVQTALHLFRSPCCDICLPSKQGFSFWNVEYLPNLRPNTAWVDSQRSGIEWVLAPGFEVRPARARLRLPGREPRLLVLSHARGRRERTQRLRGDLLLPAKIVEIPGPEHHVISRPETEMVKTT